MNFCRFLVCCCTLFSVAHAADYVGANHMTAAAGAWERAGVAQPIWWFPWGAPAFVTARSLNRPIVLWIGSAAVPNAAALDAALAATPSLVDVLNQSTVPVRVDAAALPDVAGRYGIAARAIGGGGMLPALLVLNSRGDPLGALPVSGATPPAAAALEAALRTILHTAPTDGTRLRQQLGKYFVADWAGTRLPALDVVLQSIQEFVGGAWQLRREAPADLRQVPTAFLRVCWWLGVASHNTAAIQTVRDWMAQIVRGPWIDRIGGGVGVAVTGPAGPALYKTAASNAQMLLLLSDLYITERDPALFAAAEQIVRFAATRLLDHARDVAWHYEMIPDALVTQWEQRFAATLPHTERQVLLGMQGAAALGARWQRHDAGVARTPAQVAAWLDVSLGWVHTQYDSALRHVADARNAQHSVELDTAAYADDNAMLYTALLRAALVMDRPAWAERARHGMDWWWMHAVDAGWGVRHSVDGAAPAAYYLADQAWWLAALLARYEAGGDKRDLARARQLAGWIEQHFADATYGGFRDVAYRDPAAVMGLLDLPWRPFIDTNGPAANPLVAIQLTRLAVFTADPHWRDLAGGVIYSVANVAQPLYRLFPTYAHALWQYLEPPRRVVIAGPPHDRQTQALLALVLGSGDPNIAIEREPESFVGKPGDFPEPQVMVCADAECSEPTASPGRVLEWLHP